MIAITNQMRRTVIWMRNSVRLGRLAWERRHEIGWVGLAVRASHRIMCIRPSHRAKPFGMALGRDDSRPSIGAKFDVIFAIGFWPGESKRYRVFNIAEALRTAGYAIHVMPFEEIEDVRRRRWRASVLVLFRAEYDRLFGVKNTLSYARQKGIRLVYDIDDLVFDPSIVDLIDAVRLMQPYERRLFVNATIRRLRRMRACDAVTVSTAPLARAVSRLGCHATILPNSLNRDQLRLAADIAAERAGYSYLSSTAIVVGYFSGSPTHQRDFRECESVLLDIIERHPRVLFRAVGYLELGANWDRLGERVERIPLLSPEDLLHCIAKTDINLVPLELGNPFCEAKSELKFFEAALLGVPTIASATEPFTAAMEHGVSGFLVRGPAGWRAALELLVTDAHRRRAIGAAAHAGALAAYGPITTASRAAAAFCLPSPSVDGRIYVHHA